MTAQAYNDLCSHDEGDPEQREHTRAFMGRILTGTDVLDDAGMIIIGPGPYFIGEHGEFDPTLARVQLARPSEVIVVDFDPRHLHSTREQVERVFSRDIKPKLILAKRDLTEGFSSQFHIMVLHQLEKVTDKASLMDFIEWVSSLTVESISDYKSQHTSEFSDGYSERVVVSTQKDFLGISGVAQNCRVAIMNMILAGFFAPTEAEVREKFFDLYNQDPSIDISTVLQQWQGLILKLCNHSAPQFLRKLFDSHPDLKVFATTETNVLYPEEGVISDRLSLRSIEDCLPNGVEVKYRDLFTAVHKEGDDEGRRIHKHNIVAFEIGNKSA